MNQYEKRWAWIRNNPLVAFELLKLVAMDTITRDEFDMLVDARVNP
jgi:hypothetical protein